MPDSTSAISSRLQQLLIALNISSAELCRQTGMAANRWSQYVNGERRITLDAATLLSKHYGVSLDWLYLGDESGLPLRIVQKLPRAA